MNDLFCQAIHEKRLFRVNYTVGIRTVEPHAYGENSQGNELLRVYQIAGPDVSPKFQPIIGRALGSFVALFGRLVQSDKGLTPYLIVR